MKFAVRVIGFTRKFMPISFVKLVRTTTGEGLASAKDRLDRLTMGETIELEFGDEESANHFVRAVEEIGGKGTVSTM